MGSSSSEIIRRNSPNKPHAVCIPFPAQGHINPMTKLARLLHHRGFHITFVHTDYNYRRLLRSRGSIDALPSFRFETIPDGLPPCEDGDVTQDIPSLCASMDKNCAAPFKKLLEKLAAESEDEVNEVPPVTCIISDVTLPFTLDVAEDMGIREVQLWTASVCGFLGYALYRPLVEKGLVPVQDPASQSILDTVLDWAPEPMKGIRLRDLPTFIKTTDKTMLDFLLSMMQRVPRSSAIILNTFESLEGQFISSISNYLPPLYPCGPFHLLLDQIHNEDQTLSLIKSNLWKVDENRSRTIQQWLDTKPHTSVVYVNFGSITVMSSTQLIEFAWGLANSCKTFLWIIRPDLVSGESAILPPEFVTQTNDRGLLASWCDQEQVLKHPAIGGFLTHNGWNSTIESLVNGVPMISWPFFAEQQTNFWYCQELSVAMRIDMDVKREEVAKQVKELMDEEKGMEMRKRAKEWKRLASEVVSPKGSGESWVNFDKFINEMLLSRN